MITEMDPTRFVTHSLHDLRIQRILCAALDAVDPYRAVLDHLPALEGRVFGLGIGKAALAMMDALAERISLSDGLAVTKYASSSPSSPLTPSRRRRPFGRMSRKLYSVIEGGHPIPDARSLHAGERVLEYVASLKEDDTLVCLISGGGSALVTAPHVPLEDLQALTSMLLSSGARIDEINILRRQLDRVKGGGLARATQARIISLILSDVIGNPLETIASGPTVPDPTTPEDAIAVLQKYQLENRVPNSVIEFLESSSSSHSQGVLLKSEKRASRLQSENIIIGDNQLAAQAAVKRANDEGFHARILTNALQGEASEVGVTLARKLRDEISMRPRPFCLIAGGETTVRVRGEGKGGRNQELALSAVDELDGLENVLLIALATDGDDGPTDAAGAVVTGESAQRAGRLGLDAADSLSRNDAYPFFEALGDLLKPGPTGTNVNDLVFLLAI